MDTMERVQKMDRSSTTPSSKTFRDELNIHHCCIAQYLEHTFGHDPDAPTAVALVTNI
jgi:hypothetical protein